MANPNEIRIYNFITGHDNRGEKVLINPQINLSQEEIKSLDYIANIISMLPAPTLALLNPEINDNLN